MYCEAKADWGTILNAELGILYEWIVFIAVPFFILINLTIFLFWKNCYLYLLCVDRNVKHLFINFFFFFFLAPWSYSYIISGAGVVSGTRTRPYEIRIYHHRSLKHLFSSEINGKKHIFFGGVCVFMRLYLYIIT